MDKLIIFIIIININVIIPKNIDNSYYILNGIVFIYTNHVCDVSCKKLFILSDNVFDNNCKLLYKDIYIDTIKKTNKTLFFENKKLKYNKYNYYYVYGKNEYKYGNKCNTIESNEYVMLKRINIYYIKQTKFIVSPDYPINTNICMYEHKICNLTHGIYIIWDDINYNNDKIEKESTTIKYNKIPVNINKTDNKINNTRYDDIYSDDNYNENPYIKTFNYNTNNTELNELLTNSSDNKNAYMILILVLILIICLVTFIAIKDKKKESIYEEIMMREIK